MPDPVLNRPMFSGGQPPAPQGPGGILGLVEDGPVGEFKQGVENSQDYGQLMDTIRGDHKPIRARVEELAGLVGPEDAAKTPLSVLTVAQPAIKLLVNGSGIASLMDQGQQAQPPQQPVQGFADGGEVTEEGSHVGEVPWAPAARTAPQVPVPQNTYDEPPVQTIPVGDFTEDYGKLLKMQQGIMGPPRSLDDIIKERRALFGDDNSSAVNANLALMALGGRIMSTPGNLGTAIGSALPEFSTNLQKIVAQKAAIERELKNGALEQRDRDQLLRQKTQLEALEKAYTQNAETKRTNLQVTAQAQQGRANRMHSSAMQSGQQAYDAAKSGIEMEFRAKEAEINRQFQTGERQGAEAHSAELAKLSRELQERLQEAQQKFLTGERKESQQFSSGERKESQQFSSAENDKTRQHQTELQTNSQTFQGDQGDKNRKTQLDVVGPKPYILPDKTQVMVAPGQMPPPGAVPMTAEGMTFLGIGKPTENAMKGSRFRMNDGSTRTLIQRGTQYFDPDTQKPVTGVAEPLPEPKAADNKTVNFQVKDNNAPGGVRQVMGFTDGTQIWATTTAGERRYYTSDEILPDSVKVTERKMGDDGVVRETVVEGPQRGTSVKMSPGEAPQVATPPGVAAPGAAPDQQSAVPQSAIPTPGASPVPGVAQQGINPDKVWFGRMTETRPKPYAGGMKLKPAEEAEARKTISVGETFDRLANDFEKQVPDSVGIVPKIQHIAGNLDVVLPGNWTHEKAEAGRIAMLNWIKAVQQNKALNDRYPVAEMARLETLAGNPEDWFRSPGQVIASVREVQRQIYNDVEEAKARIENREAHLLKRMPTGLSENDPWDASKDDQRETLRRMITSGMDLRGLYIYDPRTKSIVQWNTPPRQQVQ